MAEKKEINLDELKAKFGELKVISTGNLTAYFRKPDMKIWRFASKALEKSATQFKVAMATNCFVGGDRELIQSPYLEDVADVIDEFVSYSEATIEKEGNAFKVTVLEKSCKLRPITIEMQTEAERNNPEKLAFADAQSLLKRMWIDGDEEILDEKQLDYHMPVLQVLKKLREKHTLSVKNA
jgi:hypothetical protein